MIQTQNVRIIEEETSATAVIQTQNVSLKKKLEQRGDPNSNVLIIEEET